MTLEKMNLAFDSLKEHFDGSFHTCLWRVCVDNITSGKVACFVNNYKNGGLQLGVAIANEPGYIPCPAYFKNTNYDHAQEVLSDLNKIVFSLEEEAADQILISSMGRGINRIV